MLGLSDLYWHGSPTLHWLPFCLCVCLCACVCVLWTWPRWEWMMFGSKPRNSGLWNFHNPNFSFLCASTLETVALLILDAHSHRALYTHTHTHTHTQTCINTNTVIHIQSQTKTECMFACRHSDIWRHKHACGKLCLPLLELPQVSDDIIMIILERFKHCNTHPHTHTHTGSYGSDCASQRQPGLSDFDIKGSPTVWPPLWMYSHTHAFCASYKFGNKVAEKVARLCEMQSFIYLTSLFFFLIINVQNKYFRRFRRRSPFMCIFSTTASTQTAFLFLKILNHKPAGVHSICVHWPRLIKRFKVVV